jgi:hypothetical protein
MDTSDILTYLGILYKKEYNQEVGFIGAAAQPTLKANPTGGEKC